MPSGIRCPKCKSTKVWKRGKVPNLAGPKQRYICYECGKSFYMPEKPKLRRTR